MIRKSGYRFPACAKAWDRRSCGLLLRRANAGRERSCSNKKKAPAGRDRRALKSKPQRGRGGLGAKKPTGEDRPGGVVRFVPLSTRAKRQAGAVPSRKA